MKVQGVKVTATANDGHHITDEEAERIYLSLENNFAIKSIDMFMDQDLGTIDFLLGVEKADWANDSDEFLRGVVNDALTRAFGGDTPEEAVAADFREELVGAF